MLVTQSCLTLCNPMDCSLPGSSPWNSPGKNTGVGCHSLLQGIFPTQRLNLVSHIASRFFVIVVPLPSRVQLLETPWTAACQAPLSLTISWSLSTFMSLALVMPCNHLILCCPLLLLLSIFPNFRVFSSESAFCIRWPKYWSFSLSINPSNEYSMLISFRITGWISFLSKELSESSLAPQFESINSLTLCLPYGPALTTICDCWKDHSLDYTDFVGKVMSLLYGILSRLFSTT